MTSFLHLGKAGTETLDSLHEGLQVISFDWRYIYVNETVIKQSRFEKKEDLLGYTMMEKHPGIEDSALFAILQNCMAKRLTEHFLNEFTFNDGSKGWFELRIEPVPSGICILSMDVTQRKQAEDDTLKYIHGLEKMLYLTSHKVRQPVVNLQGMSSLLERPQHSQEDLERIAGYMKESLSTLDAFTRELTTFLADMRSIGKQN